MRQIIQGLSAITIACAILSGCNKVSDGNKSDAAAAVTDSLSSQPIKDSVTVELVGADSVTVFDLLKSSHKVDYITTAGGVFVKGIDSIQTSSNTFWTYTINDTAPQVAADLTYTRAGDKVAWHFRKMAQ